VLPTNIDRFVVHINPLQSKLSSMAYRYSNGTIEFVPTSLDRAYTEHVRASLLRDVKKLNATTEQVEALASDMQAAVQAQVQIQCKYCKHNVEFCGDTISCPNMTW
jgi:predicted aldo/keto reductase-like oxidoreductase